MKSHTEYLVFETRKRREMVHITDEVEQIVAAQRREGRLVLRLADAHHGGNLRQRSGRRAHRRHRQVARRAGAGAARLQAPSHRRGQWRRASESRCCCTTRPRCP